ncbi:MAG: glycosyltransferase family 39 protein [bacterium]
MRIWRDRWLCAAILYAGFVCVMAGAAAHSATSMIDGNVYFEMARQMTARGSYEVPNGLEVVDSGTLHLGNTVQIGRHLIAKYPPLYSLLAAPFYALFGLAGLVGMNILSLGLVIVAFFVLARRLFDDRQAFYCALALPFATPLFLYSVVVLPHLVAAALVLWSLTLAVVAQDAETPRPAFLWGLAAGLLGGLAVGVRLQDILPAAVLLYLLARRAQRPWAAPAGMLAGLSLCIGAMGLLNLWRFGSLNPISYGPAGHRGSPIGLETSGFLLERPAYLVLIALLLAIVLLFRGTTGHRRAVLLRLGAAALGVLVIVAIPALRVVTEQLLRSGFGLLVDASLLVHGFAEPITFHGLIYKSLLQASPLLVLGLGAAVWYSLRRAPFPVSAAALTCLLFCGFLATRHLDPGRLGNVLGIAAFGTRYLVEVYALLFLLACTVVAGGRPLTSAPRSGPALAGLAVGLAGLWWLAWSAPEQNPPLKRLVILYASLGVAALLVVGLLRWRRRDRPGLLSAMMVVSLLYAAAVTVFQDTRRVLEITGIHSGWLKKMDPVLPRRLVLVGQGGAMHGAHPIREGRAVVLVDASIDQGRDLERVLSAFEARAYPVYYFGLGLEKLRPRLDRTHVITPVLRDPLLWKLSRRKRGRR